MAATAIFVETQICPTPHELARITQFMIILLALPKRGQQTGRVVGRPQDRAHNCVHPGVGRKSPHISEMGNSNVQFMKTGRYNLKIICLATSSITPNNSCSTFFFTETCCLPFFCCQQFLTDLS